MVRFEIDRYDNYLDFRPDYFDLVFDITLKPKSRLKKATELRLTQDSAGVISVRLDNRYGEDTCNAVNKEELDMVKQYVIDNMDKISVADKYFQDKVNFELVSEN